MLDIWGFFLQTLSVSGVAGLILLIKALFKDKLPPKWHFAVWGVLGIMMLVPVGIGGRYALVRWQLVLEVIKPLFGDYSFTRVLFPFPFIASFPQKLSEWIFVIYVFGVVFYIAKYTVSYLRLRLALRMGKELSSDKMAHIQSIAAERGIKLCKVIEVSDIPNSFVCGIIRPILVISSEPELDDKVILHELFHLKNKDTLWSLLITLMRCIHWCNPLVAFCARKALNDMESRCDQYVLECLEGEERREYGRVLLSMANERFSKTPASTCIGNGGRNIRQRIENIARFKKYPSGMELVSVCVVILITVSLVIGVQADKVYEQSTSVDISLASARSTPCTTPAGAFDAYGKAILDRNGYYRAMCAPESMQAELLREMREKNNKGIYPAWDCGLEEWADSQSGYYIYNLERISSNAYEGLLVVELNYPPNGKAEEENMMYLAIQKLRVENQNGRWVTIPLEKFRHVETLEQSIAWGCLGLPEYTYVGIAGDIQAEVSVQTVYAVDSIKQSENNDWLFGSVSYFDTTPKPDAEFRTAVRYQHTRCVHLGTQDQRDEISHIGISIAPVFDGEERPNDLPMKLGDYSSGTSSKGEDWSSRRLEDGWGPIIELGDGGGDFDPSSELILPKYYAADLYLNDELVSQIELLLRKGEAE